MKRRLAAPDPRRFGYRDLDRPRSWRQICWRRPMPTRLDETVASLAMTISFRCADRSGAADLSRILRYYPFRRPDPCFERSLADDHPRNRSRGRRSIFFVVRSGPGGVAPTKHRDRKYGTSGCGQPVRIRSPGLLANSHCGNVAKSAASAWRRPTARPLARAIRLAVPDTQRECTELGFYRRPTSALRTHREFGTLD